MAKSKKPVVITAFKDKAHLLRQVAASHNLFYEEIVSSENDELMKFRFSPLDEESTVKFLADVPIEVYAYRATVG